jgi:hypothetical protein
VYDHSTEFQGIRTIWLCLEAESRLLTDQQSVLRLSSAKLTTYGLKAAWSGVSLKGAASGAVAAKAQLEDEPGNQ